jgi:hypothetical protein
VPADSANNQVAEGRKIICRSAIDAADLVAKYCRTT